MELIKDTATTATGAGDVYRRQADGAWKRLRDGIVFRAAESRGTVILLNSIRYEGAEE